MPTPTLTAEALGRLIAAAEPGRRATVTGLRPITGGYSRLSAVADVRWDDGAAERLVLRGDPPPGEGVFDSDRDAEWELLQALAASGAVPVARPRWYDATGEHLGTKCIVVDHVAGRNLQEVLRTAEDPAAPAGTFVDAVAAVHAVPLDTLPAGMTRPASWDDYLDGVLDLYRDVDREIADSSPVLRYVAARLRGHRPPPVPFTLVHGDCQPTNVLVRDPAVGGHVVIDWEFARIGDPREDLGYYTQIPMQPNAYTADPAGFLARYRERTGLTEEQVNPATVEYFLVVGMARLLVQILRALDAVAAGGTRGVMATYLVNAVTHQYGLYLDVAREVAS
ncbi:phosphotransferase family protein [Trujillonella humicola]|uniref:phosphotransferase family protein n=1 Tax=Trujillonella humicola TaxID=3383699 RepID=UPI0039058366